MPFFSKSYTPEAEKLHPNVNKVDTTFFYAYKNPVSVFYKYFLLFCVYIQMNWSMQRRCG